MPGTCRYKLISPQSHWVGTTAITIFQIGTREEVTCPETTSDPAKRGRADSDSVILKSTPLTTLACLLWINSEKKRKNLPLSSRESLPQDHLLRKFFSQKSFDGVDHRLKLF